MADTGQEPESSEDPESLSEDPASPSEDSEGLEDEARRKFREALDRKRARDTGTGGRVAGNDTGKVHGAHGPAASRRSFRRRGGG
jgi:uncharacterized protein DUF5302